MWNPSKTRPVALIIGHLKGTHISLLYLVILDQSQMFVCMFKCNNRKQMAYGTLGDTVRSSKTSDKVLQNLQLNYFNCFHLSILMGKKVNISLQHVAIQIRQSQARTTQSEDENIDRLEVVKHTEEKYAMMLLKDRKTEKKPHNYTRNIFLEACSFFEQAFDYI